MQLKIIYLSILISISLNAGCPEENKAVASKRETIKPYFISHEKKFSYTAEQLKNKYGIVSKHIKNGFTAYRILYRTTNVDGKEVTASGAVLVPDIKQPLPLVAYPGKGHSDCLPQYLGTLYTAFEKLR